MDDMPLRLPYMSNIGLVMTYKCQVACPHCVIEAGPHRKEEVSLDNAFHWIREIADYRKGHVKILALTGGEPFYNIDNLKKISAYAESCGLLVSVVTNAYWATTEEEAVRVLQEIPGIKMISYSADIYHQKSIPLQRVKNAINAAKKCDLPYYISVTTENKNDEGYKQIIRELKESTNEDKIVTVTTFPAGRALKNLGKIDYETSEEPPVYSCTSASSPIIFPDGKVTACIGPVIDLHSCHPLSLGDLHQNSLQEILDGAEINPVLQAIRIWGPRKLISMIKEKGPKELLPMSYVKDSICIACYNLLSNQEITDYLAELNKDAKFKQKVAWARAYYLHETEMIEHLGIKS